MVRREDYLMIKIERNGRVLFRARAVYEGMLNGRFKAPLVSMCY
jgi:hypothetical protein